MLTGKQRREWDGVVRFRQFRQMEERYDRAGFEEMSLFVQSASEA